MKKVTIVKVLNEYPKLDFLSQEKMNNLNEVKYFFYTDMAT